MSNTERDLPTLDIAGAVCDVEASQIDSLDDQTVTLTLTEDGMEEYIRELRIQEHNESAAEWLAKTGGSDL